MLFTECDLSIREITLNDAPLLAKWLSDPRVLEFYDGRDNPLSLDGARERITHKSGEERVTGCIVEYQEQAIGFLQFYPLLNQDKRPFGYEFHEPIYGMDQFIGEPEYWNRGIGTALVQATVRYLLHKLGATKIVMDPQARNVRALACYEKSGFRKVKHLPAHELHEGVMQDCWLIEYSR